MFVQQNTDECKTDTEDKNGESDACLESPNTNKEETPLEHQVCNWLLATYRKIPKTSPEAYIFQRTFIEGLIFGGAYLFRGLLYRREICV